MKSADNIVELTDKDIKKYTKLKEGESIKSNDLVHIEENTYAKVGKGTLSAGTAGTINSASIHSFIIYSKPKKTMQP